MSPAAALGPRRPLGATGLEVSALGLGCVTFGREIDAAAATTVLERAVELGINFLDTSEAYAEGASERVLGRLLRRPGRRERLIVCTKVNGDLRPERVRRAAEASLARLGLAYVDVYLLHNFDAEHPLDETLGALHELVASGRVRHIGCSNFSAEQVAQALALQTARGWTRFSVIQPMYSLVARQLERELLPFCRRRQIGVVTYSPLGAGFLTGKYAPDQPLPAGTRFALKPGHCRHYFHPRSFAFLDTLRAEAAAAGAPPIELALAWVFTRPDISTTLIGARTTGHVEQAARAWSRREELATALDRLTAASAEFVAS